jgi:hypothetical protein
MQSRQQLLIRPLSDPEHPLTPPDSLDKHRAPRNDEMKNTANRLAVSHDHA